MLRCNTVLTMLDLRHNSAMTEKSCKALGDVLRHNRVVESLEFPGYPNCPWFHYAEFFAGCNSVHLWQVMGDENAMVPWHKVFHVLLSGPVCPWRKRFGQ
mmetsp:Transcript_22200/g.51211  ORF Transcript_22200/g.51211 Transcript_22200/m.51211 type:complete len:100 (+) Transcript_22200:335-634(+)